MKIYINQLFLSCLVLCVCRTPTVSATKNATDDETCTKPMELDWCQLRPLEGFTLETENIDYDPDQYEPLVLKRSTKRFSSPSTESSFTVATTVTGGTKVGDGYFETYSRSSKSEEPKVMRKLTKFVTQLEAEPLGFSEKSTEWVFMAASPWYEKSKAAYDPKADWIKCPNSDKKGAVVKRFVWLPADRKCENRDVGCLGSFLYDVQTGDEGVDERVKVLFTRKIPQWLASPHHKPTWMNHTWDFVTGKSFQAKPEEKTSEILKALLAASKFTREKFEQDFGRGLQGLRELSADLRADQEQLEAAK